MGKRLYEEARALIFFLKTLPLIYNILRKDKAWRCEYVEGRPLGTTYSTGAGSYGPTVRAGFSFIISPRTTQRIQGTGFALTFYNTSAQQMSVNMNTSYEATASAPDPIEPLFDEMEKDNDNRHPGTINSSDQHADDADEQASA